MEKSRAPTLHDVVLDYVINSGYAATAKVLSTSRVPSAPCSSTSTPSEPEAEGMDVDVTGNGNGTGEGIDSGTFGTPASPATPTGGGAAGGAAVGDSPIRSALAAAAARRLAATAASTNAEPPQAPEETMEEGGEVQNGTGKKSNGTIKGDGVPAIDQATLESIDHRRVIIDAILNGAIPRAVAGIQQHFPTVLMRKPSSSSSTSSNGTTVLQPPSAPSIPPHQVPVFSHSHAPEHVALNLQIQAWIESYRNNLSTPGSPGSSVGSLNGSSKESGLSDAQIKQLTEAWNEIHRIVSQFKPDVAASYVKEVKDLSGLLAYSESELERDDCPLRGFVDQRRRIALANQVNAAILRSENRPIQSHLEQLARRTCAIYSTLHAHGVEVMPSWTGDAKAADWRIGEQLKRRPFQKGGFDLHEYVWEMA